MACLHCCVRHVLTLAGRQRIPHPTNKVRILFAPVSVSVSKAAAVSPPPNGEADMEIHDEKSTQRWVLALASLASFMVALDTLVMSTALTSIQQSLGASLDELGWTVNAYNLSFAVLLTVAAAFGDRFGRRLIFSLGLALFVIASIACALSTNVAWLIAARAVQGAGAAFIMPVGMALIGAAYPPEIRGKALGIFSGVTGLAVLGGPVIGGAIARASGRWWCWGCCCKASAWAGSR
jgi:MFS family permease